MNRKLKIWCTTLLLIGIGLASASKANTIARPIEKDLSVVRDTLTIEVMQRKKSNHLAANPSVNGITFTNSLNDSPLEFFVFDLDGTLIHQTLLHPREKTNITALAKGIYLFDLFYKDESIERGKITIK